MLKIAFDVVISTHTPLAGRDYPQRIKTVDNWHISTHTPLAGRDGFNSSTGTLNEISTHTPLAGRDTGGKIEVIDFIISTHTPLAGRDDVRKAIQFGLA